MWIYKGLHFKIWHTYNGKQNHLQRNSIYKCIPPSGWQILMLQWYIQSFNINNRSLILQQQQISSIRTWTDKNSCPSKESGMNNYFCWLFRCGLQSFPVLTETGAAETKSSAQSSSSLDTADTFELFVEMTSGLTSDLVPPIWTFELTTCVLDSVTTKKVSIKIIFRTKKH